MCNSRPPSGRAFVWDVCPDLHSTCVRVLRRRPPSAQSPRLHRHLPPPTDPHICRARHVPSTRDSPQSTLNCTAPPPTTRWPTPQLQRVATNCRRIIFKVAGGGAVLVSFVRCSFPGTLGMCVRGACVSVLRAGLSLRSVFFFVKNSPWRQPLGTANRQPPSTANRHQPPTAINRPPPSTAHRHQLPTATNRPPPTANLHQPPRSRERPLEGSFLSAFRTPRPPPSQGQP